jgi:hydrogenase/urease accessory protein HupE
MNKLLIALGIGTVIALIDIAPMILRKAPLLQMATPFVHWIVVGVLVAYSSMPLPGWAKGLVIGVITTIPFLFVLAQSHPSAVWTVAGISVVLGLVMGVAMEMALGKFATSS